MKKKPSPPSPKRCACGLVRVTGRRCLHGAEPGRDRASQRAAATEARRKCEAARVEHERIGLGGAKIVGQINAIVAKFDPVTAWRRKRVRGAARGRR